MRISDWSSDVCSSDLHIGPDRLFPCRPEPLGVLDGDGTQLPDRLPSDHPHRRRGHAGRGVDAEQLFGLGGGRHGLRSEEHTSELQSLMRTSYAVFCLTHNNQKNINITTYITNSDTD